jgi:uncharacterized delta-60 repeat protein/CSLREA domain-containing protein
MVVIKFATQRPLFPRPSVSVFFILTVCVVSAAIAANGVVQPLASASTSRQTTVARALEPNTLAPASTIVVNSTADVQNNSDDLCTLREAITAANTDTASGATAGECAAGSGTDTIDLTGMSGAFTLLTALPEVSTSMSINGPGANLLSVVRSSADGTPNFRIVTVASGATVNISGVTIAGGSLSISGAQVGGNVFNNGTLTLNNCAVSGGAAAPSVGTGGGIFNNAGATLTLNNSSVSGNSAVGGAGILNSGTLSIVNSNLTGNVAGVSGGGAIYNNGPLTLTNSTISGNFGGGGGAGIFNSSSGNVTMTDSTVSANFGASSGGGGIFNGGTFTVSNATVSGNQSPTLAGGIYNGAGALTLTNVTVTNNRSDSNNSGGELGGGIFHGGGTVTLSNTIVAGNFRGTGSTADDISGSVDLTSSFNLIGTGGAGGLTNGVNNNQVNVANAALGPLANNGGLTFTHALLTGSSALDAGSNALSDSSGLTNDQRGAGFSRKADSADANTTQTVDIGAFEAHASVEDISDKVTSEDAALLVNFRVADATLITGVSASSSNPTLVPNVSANLNVTGSGQARTLNITPAANQFGTSTITVTVTTGTETVSDTFLLTVNSVNDSPTDIALSNNAVADNSASNTLVGTFSNNDPDVGDTFTYTLVTGAGSIDNGSFTISHAQLLTNSIFDFETKPTYSIRVRVTDQTGFFVEKQFIITITDGSDTAGAISFSAANYNVGEAVGNASITLTRTGGSDNRVVARIGLADITTSAADYVFAQGSLDSSFNTGSGATSGSSSVSQTVHALARQPDGKVIIGGAFIFYNGVSRNRIARINSDGTLDTSFNPGTGADNLVQVITLQPDGKILIGGSFTNYNGSGRTRIARLNQDGTLDLTFFGGAPTDVVRAIAVQPDGKILIAGDFTFYNGISRNRVARLNHDGGLDFSFTPGVGPNAAVSALYLQPDGKLIVGGGFTNFAAASNTRIVRLQSNGSLDPSFNSALGLSMAVRQALVQTDGKIFVAGEWIGNDTPYGKQGIVRLESSGSVDASFNPGLGTNGHTVQAFAIQPDSKVVIVGAFPSYNGTPINGVARLHSGGSLDSSFNPGGGPNSFTSEIVLQDDGKIIIGGNFTFYGGVSSNGIARINGDLFVTWMPGDVSNKVISLPIVDDTQDETSESLSLTVTPVFGGATTGTHPSSVLTILDNEPSPTALSSVSGTGAFGGTATLTATLTSGGSNISGRTISFTLNATPVGNATTDSNGIATLSGVSIASIGIGVYPAAVGASFTGDGIDYLGSSNTGPLTVTKGNPITSVSSSVNPSDFGQSVTFTAALTSSAATPTGTVQFKDGATNLGSPQTLVAGTAQVTTSSLTAGTHTITVEYSGDANFLASGATLSGGQVVRAPPTLSIDDVSITEGNSGTANLTFTVTLSASSNMTVSAGYSTAHGTATTADNDYQSTSGTLTFNPGDLTKTVAVVVNADQKTEPDETVFVVLSSPVNAAFSDSQGTGTILNDDTLQLLLDTSGPDANQLAAVDSLLLTRDPFRIRNPAAWFTSDQNTRVILFALNLQLGSGESPSVVKITLVEGNGQPHEVAAEDVRTIPNTTFTQVTFRLPDLAAGACLVTIKAHERISNTGTFRIVQ